MVSGLVLMALLTVGSKAFSFLKDAAVARQFGTGDELDAFMLVFGFLSFTAALTGGGLPKAFLPMYAETLHQKSSVRAQRLAVQSSLVHALSLLIISVVIWFMAPDLVQWTTRGFSAEKKLLATDLLRQLLPFMFCFSMSYQLGTWLRADKCFSLATSAPILVPLTIIGFFIAADSQVNVQTLFMGTLIGGVLHLLIHFTMSCVRHFEPGSVAVLGYTDKVCGIS